MKRKIYYVARVRPWHGGAQRTPTGRPSKTTYIQATDVLDCLSCDALAPIKQIEARNQREAKKLFLQK